MIKIGNSASNISIYTCQPNNNKELLNIIEERIKHEGNNCDLNDIDVSKITDMAWLFYSTDFNGDISKWNTSNVKTMSSMFSWSRFNGDIGDWDISNVENMEEMFSLSRFNKDISNWKIRKDCNVKNMFYDCHTKEEYKPKSLQSNQ